MSSVPRRRASAENNSPGRAPASFTQERLWFVSRYHDGIPLYNSPRHLRLTGLLDAGRLERALNMLRRRHDTLRTCFEDGPSGLLQVIAPYAPETLEILELQELPPAEREAQAKALAEAVTRAPLRLDEGPLMLAKLVRLAPDDHILMMVLHHTIFDGTSGDILVRELAELYEAALLGREPDLPALPVQYHDFAVWQREQLSDQRLDQLLSFWRAEMDGATPLELPTNFPRQPEQTFNGDAVRHTLPADVTAAIKAVGRGQRATLFATLTSALQVLLHRYTDQDDLTVGFPVAGRSHVELENLIGPLINVLVLRADLSANPTFVDFLTDQRRRVLMAMTHQDLPFEKLVQELDLPRATNRSPLFQVITQLLNSGARNLQKGGVHWQEFAAPRENAQVDLALVMSERSEGLRIALRYNSDLFAAETMQRLLAHYEIMLRGIAANPQRRISDLPLLTAAERRQLLVTWNQTEQDYPRGECLHDLFLRRARRTPDAVAAARGEDVLTYRELDELSDRLAGYLAARGATPGHPIGLYVSRSLDIPVAFMGALKSGGVALPIDPAYPMQRVQFMLEDSGARLIVASPELVEQLDAPPGVELVPLDPSSWKDASLAPLPAISPDQLAYLAYTSGSTGRPKGVGVYHRGMVSLLTCQAELLTPEAVAGMMLCTSISFDVGIFTILAALSTGGCLIIGDSILDLIFQPPQQPVTLLLAPQSAVAEVLRHADLPDTVHTVGLVGEVVPGSLVRQLYEQSHVPRVHNLYGPTETTVYSTACVIPRDTGEHPSIGRPVANTRVYVLDKYGNPVPVGVRGELCIGGVGVAAGYLGRPELTAERFPVDPFVDDIGARMYRTGDVAHHDAAGKLHYLGRRDFQVKIRGNRVELEEVQNALLAHPAVQQAAVVARPEASGTYALAAYVALKSDAAASREELRQHLAGTLPDFMIPTFFTFTTALPLRASGKVDLEALPSPEVAARPTGAADETGTLFEEQLRRLWVETLEVEPISLDDSFFDIGGHSLLAARLFARIRQETGRTLPLSLLFHAPTIREIAQTLYEPAS